MNYLISIPVTSPTIRAIKIIAVAGALTTANSSVTIDDEYIADCSSGDSVVVFEAGSGTIPAAGIPTGNYDVYYSTAASPAYSWNKFTDMGTVSIFNNDTGTLIEAKATLTTVQSAIAVVTGQTQTNATSISTLSSRVDTHDTDIAALGTEVYKTKQVVFDYSRISDYSKPTRVTRGILDGYSLPVNASDNEELYCNIMIPEDMDVKTDPELILTGWLDTANTAKKFKISMEAQVHDFGANTVVSSSSTSHDEETTTGTWAQYTSFDISYTLDATTLGITEGDGIALRIFRKAASADEITGEVVIHSAYLKYVSDKAGTEV